MGKCGQEGCTVEKDGKCLEGFEILNECPHFIPAGELKEQEIDDELTITEQPPDIVNLYDGFGLNYDAAAIITRRAVTRIIIIAGAAESGKTTLLASLYECFQSKPFAGYLFAGSRTLQAFEKRCYLSRIASGKEKADTERTIHGTDEVFLHLCVRTEDLSKPVQDILFTDFSGETFRQAKDSIDSCKELKVLLMADHFVLLIDGEKLTQPGHQHEAYHDSEMLLRSCLDANMLGKQSNIDVLFTKWDEIEGMENEDDKSETKKFIQHIEKKINGQFQNHFKQLRFFRIAARPENLKLPFAWEIEKIFPLWVEEMREYAPLLRYEEVMPNSEREFDHYLSKYLTKHNIGDKN